MHHSEIKADVRKLIADGTVLPAHPLALDANRALDVRHQRALTREQLPDDVTGAVVYLTSKLSRFVTGQVLYLDGGLTATQ